MEDFFYQLQEKMTGLITEQTAENLSPIQLLVILDIDETILQFLSTDSYKFWNEVTPEKKLNFDYIDNFKHQQVVLFRPFLDTFFSFVKKYRDRIKIALWTYSPQSYANLISSIIKKHFKLPEDIFLFIYGKENIYNETFPKSLKTIWIDERMNKQFNKINTILVDDRLSNICHNTNYENSILIQKFQPFGMDAKREKLNEKNFETSINDTILIDLIMIIKILLEDFDEYTKVDMMNKEYETYSVFNPQRLQQRPILKKKFINKYINKIIIKKINMNICSLGNISDAIKDESYLFE